MYAVFNMFCFMLIDSHMWYGHVVLLFVKCVGSRCGSNSAAHVYQLIPSM